MNIAWTFCSAAEFKRLAITWDELNQHCGRLPFLDSYFVEPLLTVFGTGSESIALGRRDGNVVAAAIIYRNGLGRWALFQPSQMPLGPFLVLPHLAVDAVAESLLQKLPGFNLALGLTQLDPALGARPDDSGVFSTLDYIDTAWVDIDGDFDTYWAARGKNLRQNMRKQRNKLAADGVVIAFDVIRGEAEVEEALRQYGTLESSSWKSGEGTAVNLDNEQGRFYKAMLEAFCRAGRGVVYRYRFGEQVVAIDLCVESGDILVILKTAYDSSNKSLSPAFLMREEEFQHLFAEGRIKRVEFFGRLMEWHTRWTEEKRTLYHANAYRHAAIPRLLAFRRKRQGGDNVLPAETISEST